MEADLFAPLTEVEQLASFYSDYFKELHGFRPRGGDPKLWESPELLRAAIAELDAIAPAIQAEQEAQDKACIARFEALVAKTIEHGAGSRETALRWIMDASDCQGDWEYLCFHHGLPYGYFKEKKSA